MFRKGDEAFIRATGETITVQGPLSFAEEKLLHRAHPTVLNSIKAGPDASNRHFEETKKEWSTPKEIPANEITTRSTLYRKIQDCTIQFNGHYYKARPRRVRDFLFIHGLLDDISFDDVEQLLKAIEQGKALRKRVYIGTTEVFSNACCPHCGQREFSLAFNGKVVRTEGEPCPYPKGFPQIVQELNIPSGKLVFGDDSRTFDEIFPFPLPYAEADFVSQQKYKVLQAEKKGFVSFRFGQVSPRLYQLDKDFFKIINWQENERWDAKKNQWVPIKTTKVEGEEITGTEYGFTACDGDVYKQFVDHLKPEDLPETTILDVTPGVYQFRVFVGALYAKNSRKEIRYAEIRYLRAPDEPRDYLAEYLALKPTPEQVVRAQVEEWPTLYGARDKTWETLTEAERYHSWHRIADTLFFVNGGGIDWHQKGFPLISVADTPPDPTLSIPKFREQLPWYPFSENYCALGKKTNLTPEFAKFAFEALESVISFGAEPRDDPKAGRDVQRCREMMVLALKWYRKLAKRYPASADPDFLAWVSEKGRADAWVKMFDLGPEFTDRHHANFTAQKWLPDDVQYLEFDAQKLKDGHFAWKKGYWAKKEDAECYAIPVAEGTSLAWFSTATKHIPLYAVVKVLETGVRDHCGKRIVAATFEYGSEWMQDPSVRKGFFEHDEKAALRPLTKEEYEELLPKAKDFT